MANNISVALGDNDTMRDGLPTGNATVVVVPLAVLVPPPGEADAAAPVSWTTVTVAVE
jgi:hypothetical protein